MKKTLLLTAVLSFVVPLCAAAPLEYFLPQGSSYDADVPTPSLVLGGELGEWHARYDQIVQYMYLLAQHSNRVRVEETGRTYENRPILLVTLSSPSNLKNIDALRRAHAAIGRPGEAPPGPDQKSVIWLCYSIHGNESSGANASMLTAYYLAACRDPEVRRLLDECVVLIDPSLNPDGLDRFAEWTNSHRGMNPVKDRNTREHNEAWPSGRTNHYWFDLNRDWLLLAHPESRARVHTFHRWKPDILCDFHEMGTDATYFFQPGVPSRTNPWTPEENQDLTRRIAEFHAEQLDEAGRLYYSAERFDDFYYGKGSTYPDVNGCVGILFEQASSRGRRQDSVNGVVEFPFTIKNQFLTTLSSMRACKELRSELLRYKVDFFRESRQMADRAGSGGYIFGDQRDLMRTDRMAEILASHDIEVRELQRDVSLGDLEFKTGKAYVVPYKQDQYRLVEACFEERTSFSDSLFYDVSTWTLPLSMGLPYAKVKNAQALTTALPGVSERPPAASIPQAFAYAIPWEGYLAPKAANTLLEAGLRVRVATRPMTLNESTVLTPGALIIPGKGQSMSQAEVHDWVLKVAAADRLPVIPVDGGLTPAGPDLGSPSTPPLDKVVAAIVVGSGVRSGWAGEIWHLLDYRMGMEVSQLEKNEISRRVLKTYTHLILPHGNYGDLCETQTEAVREWVREGGILMALGGAVSWVGETGITPVSFVEDEKDSNASPPDKIPYGRADLDSGSRLTGGAIFKVNIDTTHPLGFGYSNPTLSVFRNHNRLMKRSQDPYATVAYYTEAPLESGYISKKNLDRLPGTASVIAQRNGRGAVLLYNDDPNFRGIWYGTNKLFLNGLFFGSLVQKTSR